MRIRLPKDLRSAGLSLVSPFDLNTFDMDLVVPAVFFSVLSEGRSRARPKANDPEQVEKYIDGLAGHPLLVGFDSPDGRRVLGRLVRTSLAQMGAVGRGRTGGEQIVAVAPLTLLAHKPGFPTMSGRLRGVDTYVFRVMRDQLGSADQLRDLFRQYFGRGVRLGNLPQLGGEYDGETEIDVMSRLHLAFMDVFATTSAIEKRRGRAANDCCRAVSQAIGQDLMRYLIRYGETMPVEELARKFATLLNFELFIYTLKLVYALNQLVADPKSLPAAFQEALVASEPQIFVDFTRQQSSISSQVSAACVRRDLEALNRFMHSARLVTQLNEAVGALRRREPVGEASGTPAAQVQALLLARNSEMRADIEAAARVAEARIRAENLDAEGEGSALDEIEPLLSQASDDIDRVVQILIASQGKELYQSLTKWYWGTGGVTKRYGLINGRLKGRSSWRYQPSDELVVVLMELAAAQLTNGSEARAGIRLQAVLDFLSARFGLAIAQPISPYEGAEYAAAARENLQALLGRLRQMGIFDDLSDDFTVQTLSLERSRAN